MRKALPLTFLAVLLLSTLIGLSLLWPASSQARPEYGFTPQPPPPPPPPPPPGGEQPSGDKGGGENKPDTPPSEQVAIQLNNCPTLCPAGSQGPPSSASVQVRFPVRLVHQGSGWVAETTLSNGGSTSLAVPYPGRWDVYLTGEPELAEAEGLAGASLNLAELQASLAQEPVYLGTVEANSAGIQGIECPVCITPAVAEVPLLFLPETGEIKPTGAILILAGLVTLGAGLALRRTWKMTTTS